MSSKKNKAEILETLEKYRISSQHSNAAYKVPHSGGHLFLKIYREENSSSPRRWKNFLEKFGKRKPVEFQSAEKRKMFEEKILRHWKNCGYDVPEVLENPFSELKSFAVLTTEFVDGKTLREILSEQNDLESKLRRLFSEINTRHENAFARNDNQLFHLDSNARNILFSGEKFFRVDFEMGRPWESPLECGTREILKLLVSLADESPSNFRGKIFELFRGIYQQQKIYDAIQKNILGRPFQNWHRARAARKKQKRPENATLYDIADLLKL